MKIEIKTKEKPATFTPYKVIFHINSLEDSIKFHDNVAIQMGIDCHEFIGCIYRSKYGAKNTTFYIDLPDYNERK